MRPSPRPLWSLTHTHLSCQEEAICPSSHCHLQQTLPHTDTHTHTHGGPHPSWEAQTREGSGFYKLSKRVGEGLGLDPGLDTSATSSQTWSSPPHLKKPPGAASDHPRPIPQSPGSVTFPSLLGLFVSPPRNCQLYKGMNHVSPSLLSPGIYTSTGLSAQ